MSQKQLNNIKNLVFKDTGLGREFKQDLELATTIRNKTTVIFNPLC